MLLTGCASGIGAHLASALSRRGHVVLATDVDVPGLAARAEAERWDASRVSRQALDVRDAAAWESALDACEARFGPVDVVMNVAGFLAPDWIHTLDVAACELTLDVNVLGTILGTRAAARRMRPRRCGHVVNVGSLASLAAVPGLAVYSASKFAVRGFSLAAAAELAPHGVAVTLVMPDAVETPMLALQEEREESALTFSGDRPLTVEDVARAILDDVLPRRPLEVTLPPGRGALARAANAFPAAARAFAPLLRARGRRAQEVRRRGK